jgi:hypothetical protein
MLLRLSAVVAALALLLSYSVSPPVPASAEAELLAMHAADRKAHFAHDVDALLVSFPPEFIQLRDGKIERFSQGDMRKRFTEYFRGAEFMAWDDLEAPIVHVSPDGKMGWMAARVKVSINRTDGSGKKVTEDTIMSWLSTYEKHDGRWQHVANATTVER